MHFNGDQLCIVELYHHIALSANHKQDFLNGNGIHVRDIAFGEDLNNGFKTKIISKEHPRSYHYCI